MLLDGKENAIELALNFRFRPGSSPVGLAYIPFPYGLLTASISAGIPL